MKKRKIIFCALLEPERAGVVERYEMAGVYGFEYLRAFALRDPEVKKNYEIETRVFSGDSLDEEIVDCVAVEKPEMVGFSLSLKNYRRAMDLVRQIKLARPETEIIVGGPEVFAPERIMEKSACIDYAVAGEGEAVFLDLLLARIGNRDLQTVDGLCFRGPGGIIRNRSRKPIGDLDTLPPVVTPSRAKTFSDVVLYETSRGCNHSCVYCLWSPYPKRYFSLGRVKKELKYILSNKDVSRIWFIDSDFDSDPERAAEILRFVKKNNIHGQKISAFLSFSDPNPELLSLVSELFYEVPVGLQTVSGKILRALRRSWFDLEKLENALPGILEKIPAERMYMDLMYGLPGETRDDFFNSLSWCVRKNLCHINFFRLGIYPGTKLEKDAAKFSYAFDPEPPHLVYSSSTFSYADLLEIERAITNFKILSSIFGEEGMMFLERELGLKNVLLNIDKNVDAWNGFYTRINESNIADINTAGLLPHVAGYFKKNVKDRKLLKEVEKRLSRVSVNHTRQAD